MMHLFHSSPEILRNGRELSAFSSYWVLFGRLASNRTGRYWRCWQSVIVVVVSVMSAMLEVEGSQSWMKPVTPYSPQPIHRR